MQSWSPSSGSLSSSSSSPFNGTKGLRESLSHHLANSYFNPFLLPHPHSPWGDSEEKYLESSKKGISLKSTPGSGESIGNMASGLIQTNLPLSEFHLEPHQHPAQLLCIEKPVSKSRGVVLSVKLDLSAPKSIFFTIQSTQEEREERKREGGGKEERQEWG